MAETIIDINNAILSPLHNNYDKEDLYINNKKYKSVSNYIFSNLAPSPALKNSLKQAPVSVLYKAYSDDYKSHKLTEAFNYLKTAINQLYQSNKDLTQLLLSTGNSVLVFANNKNSFLGTGPDGNGKNLYGNYLMSLRDMLRDQLETKKSYEDKYKAYLVFGFLLNTITSLDQFRDDLQIFTSKSVDKILRDFGGRIQVKINLEEFKNIYNVIDEDIKIVIEQEASSPGTIAKFIRHKFIKTYNENTKSLLKLEILKNYFRQIILKKFNKDVTDVEAQITRQIQLLSLQQLQDLKERVYNLYIKGSLKFDDFDIIAQPYTDMEIESIIQEYKIVDKPSVKGEDEKKMEVVYVPPIYEDPFSVSIDYSDNLLKISSQKPLPSVKLSQPGNQVINFFLPNERNNKYSAFSPNAYNGPIVIDQLTFYSPHSYTVYELYKNFCGMSSEEAYSRLFKNYSKSDSASNISNPANFKQAEQMNNEFRDCEQKTTRNNMVNLISSALLVKFKDTELKQLLVSTKENIIYKDIDSFLGTGADNKGSNFMGIILKNLREEFKKEGIEEKVIERKVQSLSSLVSGNKILGDWINDKVGDFVRSVNIFSNLLGDNIKLDKYFIIFVMKNLYPDCFSYLSSKYKQFEKCPEDFKNKIDNLLQEEKESNLILLEEGEEGGEDEEQLRTLEEAGLLEVKEEKETKSKTKRRPEIGKIASKEKINIYLDENVTMCDVIWTYIFGITRLLLEQVVKSDNPTEEKMEDVIKLLSLHTIKEKLDCDGNLSALLNCVVNFIKRIRILIKTYAQKSGLTIDTSSYEFTKLTLSLLLPKKLSIDNVLEGLDFVSPTLDDMSKMELLSIGLTDEIDINESIKAIYYFTINILDYPDKNEILKIKSRILSFSK